MFYWPSVEHFLFGAGFLNESNHGYYLPDPGIMKILLAFGIFGFISFYLFNIFSAAIFLRFFDSFNDFSVKIFMATLILLTFAFEFKEPGLYQNYNFKIFALLVMSYLLVGRALEKETGNV
ncbi:hypothetical protein [Glaciecola sp. SC05]|uniref:hypothetical protein n=1 Tax=Glaciecola sp. SC05 TaxID=1987355 RepID=UPI00352921FE